MTYTYTWLVRVACECACAIVFVFVLQPAVCEPAGMKILSLLLQASSSNPPSPRSSRPHSI